MTQKNTSEIRLEPSTQRHKTSFLVPLFLSLVRKIQSYENWCTKLSPMTHNLNLAFLLMWGPCRLPVSNSTVRLLHYRRNLWSITSANANYWLLFLLAIQGVGLTVGHLKSSFRMGKLWHYGSWTTMRFRFKFSYVLPISSKSKSLGTQLWEIPFGEVIEGMENAINWYSYGDMPPWGKGPVQGKI